MNAAKTGLLATLLLSGCFPFDSAREARIGSDGGLEPANGAELRRLRARIKLLEAENDDLSDENDRLWEENQILKRRRR